MYDVSVDIQHDVAVVSVLDLDQEADHAVGGHRHDEVPPRRLELFRVFVAVLLQEVLVHADVRLSTELVSRFRVRHTLDHSTLQKTHTLTTCLVGQS